MNRFYNAYIELGKKLANEFAISWNIETSLDGSIKKEQRWNLTYFTKSTPPPTHWLSDLGEYTNVIKVLQEQDPSRNKMPLTKSWQDLIKTVILEACFIKRIKTGTIIGSILPPLKVIATANPSIEPWELKAEHLLLATNIARKAQKSGALADWVIGVTKNIIDQNHISNFGPLYPQLNIIKRIGERRKYSSIVKSQSDLLHDLKHRKKAEKLPDKRAFWELIRIVFTEQPLSFMDALKFAQVKLMLICGLRVGEASLLPADWKRKQNYTSQYGTPVGKLGGYSQALMLRHFAEKQQLGNQSGAYLHENTQYVPQLFADILEETLDNVLKMTQPLRETLEKQIKQNRLLPWFNSNDYISAKELYPYLSGNPVFLESFEDDIHQYKEQYLKSYDKTVFDHLIKKQMLATTDRVGFNFYMFYNRLSKKINWYTEFGSIIPSTKRKDWNNVYLSIREIEHFLQSDKRTKLSDTTPFPLNDGKLQPYELLFLMPKRALSEQREGGLFDISRSYGVGIFDPSIITNSLTGSKKTTPTLFQIYGKTEEDRQLYLNPHSLRHLQNGELFRLGVADTIITKRFNRKSIAMSYEYDHRSLSEKLDHIDLPDELEARLGDKTSTVAKLIKSNHASGSIVETFKKIQKEQGDNEAFDFLKVEADGFHSTPYGHCVNSFTVDPCPKNLECFAGCSHLSATNLPEQRKNLELLLVKFENAATIAKEKPSNSIGRNNQIEHANQRIKGIKKLLNTPTGEKVFPNGQEISIHNQPKGTILDD